MSQKSETPGATRTAAWDVAEMNSAGGRRWVKRLARRRDRREGERETVERILDLSAIPMGAEGFGEPTLMDDYPGGHFLPCPSDFSEDGARTWGLWGDLPEAWTRYVSKRGF
jgi:hypothetical protein